MSLAPLLRTSTSELHTRGGGGAAGSSNEPPMTTGAPIFANSNAVLNPFCVPRPPHPAVSTVAITMSSGGGVAPPQQRQPLLSSTPQAYQGASVAPLPPLSPPLTTSPAAAPPRFSSSTHNINNGGLSSSGGGGSFNTNGALTFGNGRFVLQRKIGAGSYGTIYRAFDTVQQEDVAMKLEPSRARHPQLAFEIRVYRLLHNSNSSMITTTAPSPLLQAAQVVVGFPKLIASGIEGDHNYLVMQLCGPSLEDLFGYCMMRLSLKSVLMVAEQLLHRIDFLHQKTLIHRDIKPENLVFGNGPNGCRLYLIDFGLCKKFMDARANVHIPFREGKPLTGTLRYCSINAHKKFEQSRRDDLESIGYVLIYLLTGRLPWQGLQAADLEQRTRRIGEIKMRTPLKDLCSGCPPEFEAYMAYCRGLSFDQAPDYVMLRETFGSLARRMGIEYDWEFDWLQKRDMERSCLQSALSTNGGDSYSLGQQSEVRSTQFSAAGGVTLDGGGGSCGNVTSA